MKTFNIMKLVAVLAMGISLSAFGFFGCGSRCATKCTKTERTESCAPCAGKSCILKPEPVEIVKTCDHPGYYRQVCRLEYEPCQGQVTRHKACPIFKGCFEEGTNNRLDGAGSASEGVGYRQQNATVEVIAPEFNSDITYGGQATNNAIKNNKKATVKQASKSKAKVKKAVIA